MTKKRARELGLPLPGKTGPHNAITDVPGVKVGFKTLTDRNIDMRTGVTAITPRGDEKDFPTPVWAGQFTFNGNGEMTGTHWINDAGYFLGPICLTNTHGIGAAHSGATKWMIARYARYFTEHHAWAMPVIAETYDGTLNDINAMFVKPEHAIEALDSARGGPVEEGSTGGGNGMICYGFKGGTGTSSRIVMLEERPFTVGALVQANHGQRKWLTVCGRNVGAKMNEDLIHQEELGSIIVIVATDAPLNSLQLRHFAKRASIGIGRSGTPGGNNSGDIFLAFSVANATHAAPGMDGKFLSQNFINNDYLDPFYLAVVEAVDEAILNALVAGEDAQTVKPRGRILKAIDTDRLKTFF